MLKPYNNIKVNLSFPLSIVGSQPLRAHFYFSVVDSVYGSEDSGNKDLRFMVISVASLKLEL